MFDQRQLADPLADLGVDDLGRRARQLASQVSQLQAEQVAVARELDRRRGREIDGSPSAWLAWQAGLQPGEARRLVSLGRRLPDLPGIARAFEDGKLSEGTVTLLASVATPETEEALLRTSEDATAGQLRTLVGKFRPLARPAAADDPDAAADDPEHHDPPSEVRVWRDETGRLHVVAEFDHADALDVEQGMGMAGDDLRREADEGEPQDGLDRIERLRTDDAQGLVRMARSYVAGGATKEGVVLHHGEPVLGTVEARFATPAQKRALLVRDGGCQFPGCGATRDLIAHHVVEYPDGPTELGNLCLLCRQHHNLVHRRRYTLRWRHGRWRFWRSDGSAVPRAVGRPARSDAGPAPPPGARHTGRHDRLDRFATDAVLQHWLDAPIRRAVPAPA